ncbi:hypothetical protein CWC18_12115, partial [Pseudoalteromonas aurantia]|uniref:hypothetical protein n=1 Tax=Pseudoalteromonas aurantia TaxID=43654 RepID=UPI001273AD8C
QGDDGGGVKTGVNLAWTLTFVGEMMVGGWRLGLIGMGPDLRQGDEFMSGWRIYFRESNGGVLG